MSEVIKVLIVEDLPTDAELCQREVKKALDNCRFLRVETRRDYLVALDDFKPDIILSDFKMPAFDGMSALKLALGICPETPFIVITGSMNEDTAVECMKAGAWDYIIKEHIKRLGSVVLNVLKEKQLRIDKRKADEALKVSEERYRRISSITSDVTYSCVTDSDGAYAIDWLSGAVEAMTGYTYDEIMTKSCWRFMVIEEDLPLFDSHVTCLKPGQSDTCELRLNHRSGKIVWVEVKTECVAAQDGSSHFKIYGGLIDITERKLAEYKIRLHETRLQDLLNLHRLEDKTEKSVLNYTLDVAVRSLESQFAFIGLINEDESVMAIHAWSKGAMEQCAVNEKPVHFPVAEAGLWGEVVRQRRPVVINDYAESTEYKKGYPQGHVPIKSFLSVPIFNTGKIVAVAAVANKAVPYNESDIGILSVMLHEMCELIGRIRSNDAILHSKMLLQKVIDTTPDWIYLKDREHRFLLVNKGFAEAQNVMPQDMVGKYDTDFFPMELCTGNPAKGIAGFHSDDMQAFEGHVMHNPKNIIAWADGTWHVYDTYKIPLCENSGTIYGALVYSRDITERQEAEDNLEFAYDKVQKTLSDFISTMSKIVEIRDPYTAGHQARVADLSVAIANELSLPAEQIKYIRIAALIHDIGKLYIPTDILSKPGKLTDIEWQLIRTHPQGSYDILSTIAFPWPIADIVLQHHERINGSGYPKGLTGDKIMLEAKIIAMADVVEAMASHRPYRQSLGIEIALEEVQQKRGILYDPEIADICIKMFKENRYILQ